MHQTGWARGPTASVDSARSANAACDRPATFSDGHELESWQKKGSPLAGINAEFIIQVNIDEEAEMRYMPISNI
jgi:hypothetical protein